MDLMAEYYAWQNPERPGQFSYCQVSQKEIFHDKLFKPIFILKNVPYRFQYFKDGQKIHAHQIQLWNLGHFKALTNKHGL